MSAVPQVNGAIWKEISVDAYYGVPRSTQPARPIVADPSSWRPVLSQAQLAQLDPPDRCILDQLQRSLETAWRFTERAHRAERARAEKLLDLCSFHPQNQDQGQYYAKSRKVFECDFIYAREQSVIKYRKKDLMVQFNLLWQRKQARLRCQRDPYATNPITATRLRTGYAHPITRSDAREGPLDQWYPNKTAGAGHQPYLWNRNFTILTSSNQHSEDNTVNMNSNSNRIYRMGSYYPVPVPAKRTVDPPRYAAAIHSTTAPFMIGNSTPTHNDSLGLSQLAELQEPPVMSQAVVEGHTSRPSLKLDTSFLSSEPNEAEWSGNDSVNGTADSTMGDESNENEPLGESDCLHMPLLEQPSAHEPVLASSEESEIDSPVEDSELSSSEIIAPPPPTNSPEPHSELGTNDNKDIKLNLEDDLENLTLISDDDDDDENSPSPDMDNQLDGTTWEKIDAEGIEQDNTFTNQIVNPQKVS
ncbi:MAG: hypothetical protein Q9195_009650 [Heterodermia aff. obscurata]